VSAPARAALRIALVTGASGRIGAFLAEVLAAAGYQLHLHTATHTQAVDTLATRLRAEHQIPVDTHCVDFRARRDVDDWITRLRADPPQLIVNNASAFPPRDTPKDWAGWPAMRDLLAVHLLAPHLLTGLAADVPGAHVVNVLDARLRLLDADRIGYEIAKHSMSTYTLLAARRLAPQARVNALAPGLVFPPPGHDARHLDRLARQRAPLARPACLDDLGRALLFLDTASSITGQVLYIDAGEHLGPGRYPDHQQSI
jgi:pteridine reductase